ncbi:unnamed protein product [Boreogadus saida]
MNMSRKTLAWANKEMETFLCILGEEVHTGLRRPEPYRTLQWKTRQYYTTRWPATRLQQRVPRRRAHQPKLLHSPEDSLYYNQLNRVLEHQGSKRKPRKLGQIKVLDGEDEYYKLLASVDSIQGEELYGPGTPHTLF